MEQNDKGLLFCDLSARLPYHVRCKIWLKDGTTEEGLLDLEHNYGNVLQDAFYYNRIKDIKPYLRPMSSMTEKEKNELNNHIFSEKGLRYFWFDDGIMYSGPDNQCFIGLGNDTIDKMMDWLNAHHFDYRGLIERGLALEAPAGMYKID